MFPTVSGSEPLASVADVLCSRALYCLVSECSDDRWIAQSVDIASFQGQGIG